MKTGWDLIIGGFCSPLMLGTHAAERKYSLCFSIGEKRSVDFICISKRTGISQTERQPVDTIAAKLSDSRKFPKTTKGREDAGLSE